MKVGDRLKEYRLKKNLTQTEVADKLNISRQSVSKWENNHSYPEIDNLIMLGNLYDVSIDVLLNQSNTKDKNTTETKLPEKNNYYERKKMVLLLLLSISLLIPFLGILTPIIISLKNRGNSFGILYLFCLLCFFINLFIWLFYFI